MSTRRERARFDNVSGAWKHRSKRSRASPIQTPAAWRETCWKSALDLHAIALAKVLTICQETENGELLIRNLLADAYVGAVVLLHGLHPQDAEARLRSKLAEMRPHWGVRGFRVDLTHVDRTAARVRVAVSDDADRGTNKALALEIEQVLTEAAPDLDRIVVEVSDKSVQTLAFVPPNSSKVTANDCDSQSA